LPNSIHVSTLLSRVFLKYLDKSTTNLSGLSTIPRPRMFLLNPPRTYYLEGGNFCAHSGYPTPSSCHCEAFRRKTVAISPFPLLLTSTRRLLRHYVPRNDIKDAAFSHVIARPSEGRPWHSHRSPIAPAPSSIVNLHGLTDCQLESNYILRKSIFALIINGL